MDNIKAIQHILTPIDFGQASDHALTMAIQLGQVLHARLTLMHVVQTPSIVGFDPGMGVAQYMDEVTAQARQSLSQYAQRVQGAGLACEAVTEIGSPFQLIVDYAATQQVDMIVMGTHGHTGLQHMLLGSVAERVVRLATCPVLVTRGEEEESAAAEDES